MSIEQHPTKLVGILDVFQASIEHSSIIFSLSNTFPLKPILNTYFYLSQCSSSSFSLSELFDVSLGPFSAETFANKVLGGSPVKEYFRNYLRIYIFALIFILNRW